MRKYLIIALMLVSAVVKAQEETSKILLWSAANGLEYRVKAGLYIGGTTPLPFPAEIREIKSYSPALTGAIEGSIIKWFTNKWGAELGLRFESKGMNTGARVKDYSLEMIDKNDGYLKGRWTGNIKTKVRSTYFTLPIAATYKINPDWRLQGGFFFSYVAEREFTGSAYDGYLRNLDPTGEKVFVDEATYDFSDDMRKFQWGGQLGAEWKAYKHLSVNANLTWGFNDIFKKKFDTITFAMYPIYLNLGFGYIF